MDAVLEAFSRTEWLVGAAVAVLILGAVMLVGFGKPYLITIAAHKERVDAEKARADRAEDYAAAQITAARADADARIAAANADHAERLAQAEHIFEQVLSEARRYADDWRGTAHITAENAKISEDRMDEVLETVRLMVGILTALQNHQVRGHLPAGQQ